MITHPKLSLAEKEYDYKREHIFRRELETFLLSVVSEIQAISSGTSTTSSLYSKREGYSVPIGTVLIT